MEYERARLLLIFQVSNPKIAAGVALVSPSSLTSPRLVANLEQLADLALWEAELTTNPAGSVIWDCWSLFAGQILMIFSGK